MESFALERPPACPRFPKVLMFQLKPKCKIYLKYCKNALVFSPLLAVAHGIYILSADTLIAEALNAYEIGEVSQKALYHSSR